MLSEIHARGLLSVNKDIFILSVIFFTVLALNLLEDKIWKIIA